MVKYAKTFGILTGRQVYFHLKKIINMVKYANNFGILTDFSKFYNLILVWNYRLK